MKLSLFAQSGSACLLLGLLLNPVQGSEPQRREYIYLSRSATPEGTARMVVEETGFPEQRTASNTRLAQGYRTRTPDVETVSDTAWDDDRAIQTDEFLDEPAVFGTRTATNLRGWQYGYTSGGRRYSAHCLTAPGYESACESEPFAVEDRMPCSRCRKPSPVCRCRPVRPVAVCRPTPPCRPTPVCRPEPVCRPVTRPVRACAPRSKCAPCRPRCPSPCQDELVPSIYDVSPARPAMIESPGYDTEFAPPQVRSSTRRPTTIRSTGAASGTGSALSSTSRYRVTTPRYPQADAYLESEMPELELSTPE